MPFYSTLMATSIVVLYFLLAVNMAQEASSMAVKNVTLLGQHPSPHIVAQDLQRRVNVSITRREMLTYATDDSSTSCLTGNPIDDCWRCDPNWHLNRQRLADCGIGFGQYALGGKGGRYYVVTDSSDNDAVNPDRGLSGGPFKTLDGRGANVHITGGGCITLQYITNVIIHNIHIHHCYQSGNTNIRSSPTHYGYRTKSDGDGVSVFGSRDIWIDHCSLSHCKDGLIDVIMGSTGITISNNLFSHHDEVMLLGHSDDYLPDSGMQVTIAFNHFGEKLVQRMPRCRRGYIHVVNNVYSRWEMYAIGGSGNPTINSQGNRYTAPANPNAKEVTKRVDTASEHWKGWNWRSEGDILMNGAFFVASGEGLELKYEKAYSVEPKSAALIDQLTMNAGVLGSRSNKLGKWTDGGGGEGGVDDSENDYGEDSDASSNPNSMTLILSFFISLSSYMFLCSSCNQIVLL
ncbi:hypothetical protein E3N88_24604 [Mikania micrantha]|uniref:Pectate lyase n=1 Tax=Mikania micrantha TaxID=192012 RepID=A0A5N6N3S0_9ASTR|nr:hypothetical protein E3N88_24604 [Mikania micrantha]